MKAPGSVSRRKFLLLGAGGALSLPALGLATRAADGPVPSPPPPSPSPSASPTPVPLPPLPRVTGAINVQPRRTFALQPGPGPAIVPELVDLQIRLLYELGFEWIRITISFSRFSSDFLAAIPYVRAARALGIHVLGLMADFSGYDLVQALVRRPPREVVVGAYLKIFNRDVAPASPLQPEPGRFAIQVLNEPVHFLGIAPDSYVREYLSPVYSTIKSRDPEVTVVSAAEVGN